MLAHFPDKEPNEQKQLHPSQPTCDFSLDGGRIGCRAAVFATFSHLAPLSLARLAKAGEIRLPPSLKLHAPVQAIKE